MSEHKGEVSAHWDDVFGKGAPDRPDDHTSWYEPMPDQSLALLDSLGVRPSDSVLDVGAGTSPLAAALIERGHHDLTVLDVSAAAIEHARRRLGPRADRVEWLVADITSWEAGRRYAVWHDRALFHFLTEPEHREAYRRAMRRALAPGGCFVVATFARSGPTHCSSLPVARYDPADLVRALGPEVALQAQERRDHTTPWGATQPFAWVAGRIEAAARS